MHNCYVPGVRLQDFDVLALTHMYCCDGSVSMLRAVDTHVLNCQETSLAPCVQKTLHRSVSGIVPRQRLLQLPSCEVNGLQINLSPTCFAGTRGLGI